MNDDVNKTAAVGDATTVPASVSDAPAVVAPDDVNQTVPEPVVSETPAENPTTTTEDGGSTPPTAVA
jgi:hypothetical protein